MLAARALPLLLPFSVNLGAPTNVYQCTAPDGAIEFRQLPCADGSQERGLVIEDRKTGWVPSKPRIDAPSDAAGKSDSRNRKSTAGGKSAKDRREEQCWKKRQLLDEVEWTLKRGYKAGQGNKLRRKRRVYEDYISKFCR